MKRHSRKRARLLAGALLASAVLALHAPAASVQLDVVVTPLDATTYDYDVTIENLGPENVILVSFTDAPIGDPLVEPSLNGPAGYLLAYDSGFGFLDFVEDTSLFAPGVPVTGFSFQSEAAPHTVFNTFTAFDEFGGTSLGTSNIRIVPEPSALLLSCLAFILLAARRRR